MSELQSLFGQRKEDSSSVSRVPISKADKQMPENTFYSFKVEVKAYLGDIDKGKLM